MLEAAEQKILEGKRINAGEALLLLKEEDIHQLALLAQNVRFQKNPLPIVTYVIDRNINYTNICISGCKFCAYYCSPENGRGYVLTREELGKKI